MLDTITFIPALPEMLLLSLTLVVLLADLWQHDSYRTVTYVLAQTALIVTVIAILLQMGTGTHVAFNGLYISDRLANMLKLLMTATVFFIFIYSRRYTRIKAMPIGEFYILSLFATLGMLLLVSAHNLLSLYLGLEIMSLPLYALVALDRDSAKASEAAIKYFVMGAVASGFILYGMSLFYGLTGSLQFDVIRSQVGLHASSHLYWLALLFVLAGIVFKLGAAPFHMWVPDVYQGSATNATLMVSTAPKLAAFGMIVRVLMYLAPALHVEWQAYLLALAALSIVLGNVIALAQSNIKRLLGFSAVAHIGYMFMGLMLNTSYGWQSALFYMVSYLIMTLAAFGLLALLSRAGAEIENIADLRGLNDNSPWMAFLMLIIMLSLAGVPPTLGFYAKLGVIVAALKAQHLWLAIVAMLMAVVGAAYYLRVIKVMYFEEADAINRVEIALDARLMLSFNALLIIILGIFPAGLWHLCAQVFA